MLKKAPLALFLVIALVAVWFGIARFRASAPSAEPVAVPSVATASEVPAPVQPAPTAPPAAPGSIHEHDGEDEREVVRRGLQKLDTKFMAETVTPEWAAKNEQVIAAAFTPEALKTANAPGPVSHEESCRSKTCKITAVYATEMDANIGQVALLAAVAPGLTSAIMGQIRGDDGSVQLVIFASEGGPKPPPRPEP